MTDSIPATAAGEMRVCPNDGEPVIFTFKYPGHEYVCLVCGWLGGVLGTPTGSATPERRARYAELLASWERKEGITPAQQDVTPPTCGGCGATAEGPFDGMGKPHHWFAKGSGADARYACSRKCIPSRELVMPW